MIAVGFVLLAWGIVAGVKAHTQEVSLAWDLLATVSIGIGAGLLQLGLA